MVLVVYYIALVGLLVTLWVCKKSRKNKNNKTDEEIDMR